MSRGTFRYFTPSLLLIVSLCSANAFSAGSSSGPKQWNILDFIAADVTNKLNAGSLRGSGSFAVSNDVDSGSVGDRGVSADSVPLGSRTSNEGSGADEDIGKVSDLEVGHPHPGKGVTYRLVPDPDMEEPPFVSPFTAPDIPLDYNQQNGTSYPEQVALSPASPDGSFMFVRFVIPNSSHADACGPFGRVDGEGQGDARSNCSVSYGVSADALDQSSSASPTRYTYAQGTEGAYTSGDIFFVPIGPLVPSTTYFYRIHGSAVVRNFTSLPRPGASYPLKFALVGDVGQTFNSSTTFDNVRAGDPQMVLFAGDLSYADRYRPPCMPPNAAGDGADGAAAGAGDSVDAFGRHKEKQRKAVCGLGGVRWDSYGRLSEKVFAHVPVAHVPGNHELELEPRWGELEPFKAYRARVPPVLPWGHAELEGLKSKAASTETGIFDHHHHHQHHQGHAKYPDNSPLFYSLNIGPVHVIAINSYSPFVKYSHQYYWLRDDLCSMDRRVTPWAIAIMHVPMYNSNDGHYLEGESMRVEIESWLHESGVALVASGHVHAYERSHPVVGMERRDSGCAPVHVTVGDGGNIEEVAGPFLEPQPVYSAYREESFGHAELTFNDNQTATYRWFRNHQGRGVLADSFTLHNRHSRCSEEGDGPAAAATAGAGDSTVHRRPSFCE